MKGGIAWKEVAWKEVVIGVLVLSFLFSPACKKADKVEIKTEDGITVVYNPKNPAPPRGVPTTLSIKEDLSLGAKGESEESMLLEPAVVDADEAGNIYVLDRKAVQIKVFDPQGNFLRAIGRSGQGPGEFQDPRYFQITPQKNILVTDPMSRRVTVFSLEGQWMKDLSTGKMWMFLSAKMAPNGDIVGSHTIMDQEARTELVRFNANMEPVGTVASVPFPRYPVLNPYFPRLYFALTPEGNVIWGVTTEYEFHVVNREGKTLRKIIKKYDPEILTQEDRDRTAKEFWGEEGPPPDAQVEWPKYFPPVEDFILDDRGWLFVRPFVKVKTAGGVFYDVFDAEGKYIARVSLPARARKIKSGKLYTIEEDKEGLLHVKRYTMEWK